MPPGVTPPFAPAEPLVPCGDVSDLRRPDTPSVAQNVTTVCHGMISGSAYAVVVFFEDASGRFTLLPV
jgi:hypothetical protein